MAQAKILNPLELNQQTTPAFLSRFSSFYDSVITHVDIGFNYRSAKSAINVLIVTRDAELVEADAWVLVRMRFENEVEFSLSEGYNVTHSVLSNAMHIDFFDGKIFVDFGGLDDPPYLEEPAYKINDYRQSPFYIATKNVKWIVEPYSEERVSFEESGSQTDHDSGLSLKPVRDI